MSLYNMLFGVNPDSDTLMGILGKSASDFGRFRNVYMENGYIVVHTRNGGGNREEYEYVFDEMQLHPWYSHDADCEFDSTYADIYFEVPNEIAKSTDMQTLEAGTNPAKQWEAVFSSLKSE